MRTEAATLQYAFEAIEPVRQLALTGDYDEALTNLRRDLVAVVSLMEIDLPEMAEWKAELEQKHREQESREIREVRRRGDETICEEESDPPRKKVGRNEPCPYGSGKKHKKCCLQK